MIKDNKKSKKETVSVKFLSIWDYAIASLVFILLGVVGYYFYIEIEKNKYVATKDKAGKSDTYLMKDGRTFIWAGFTGEYPRFISSTKMGPKGFGWGEFPVAPIKQVLIHDYNLRILERYMTPARLEFEFRHAKYPICSYPYIWKDPAKEFSNDPKFLYSIGLDFGGDKNLKIIFLKKKRHLFEKHLNPSGDLNIQSLLDDKTLKGTFVNDVDYGPVVNAIFERNETGDPVVNKKYSKNIKLIVTNNNKQLLHMLDGNRFDYTFEQLITSSHYKQNNKMFKQLSVDMFDTISYYSEKIQSVEDKSFMTYSVRCNKHPLSYRIIETMNKLIVNMRSEHHKMQIEAHRKKMEEGYDFKLWPWETLPGRFREEFSSGKVDLWYKEYKSKLGNSEFMQVLKKADDSIVSDKKIVGPPDKVKRDATLVSYQEKDRLVLLGLGDWSDANHDIDNISYSEAYFYDLSKNGLAFHFSSDDRKLIQKYQVKNKVYFDMKSEKKETFKHLTISAMGLSAIELETILKRFNNLQSLHILFPTQSASPIIMNYLTNSIKNLSIVHGDIPAFDLYDKIKNMELESLDLSGTILKKGTINQIIQHHYKTLKILKLAYLKDEINRSFSTLFAKSPWPKLEELDLTSTNLNIENAKIITKGLGPSLKKLRLDGNFLLPENYIHFFSQCPNLKFFSNDMAPIISQNNKTLELPNSLESLILKNSGIRAIDLEKIQFPPTLKALNLMGNPIDDKGLKMLGDKIPPTLEKLSLSDAKNSKSNINDLFFKNGKIREFVKKLKVLSLESMKISDEILEKILPHLTKLVTLNLKNNFISNSLMRQIGELPNLQDINLGKNFITNIGIKQLLNSKLKQKLRSLEIENLIGLKGSDLAQNMPNQLEKLNLSNNLLSSNSMAQIFQKLPTTLNQLLILGNQLDIQAIHVLSHFRPPYLSHLHLNGNFNDEQSLINLLESLPNSLQRLYLFEGVYQSTKEYTPIRYSVELNEVRITLNWSDSFCASMLSRLPESLDSVYMESSLLGPKGLNALLSYKYIRDIGITLATSTESLPRASNINLFYNITHNNFLQSIADGGFPYAKMKEEKIITPIKVVPQNYKSSLYTLGLIGPQFNDAVFPYYSKLNLSDIRYLTLDGTSFSAKNIIKFLKSISPYADTISLLSLSANVNEVDDIIAALPNYVRVLTISGAKIGEIGYRKFRDWKIRKEQELGYEIDLVL